ncbi:MAG: hypothetical protein ACOC5K_04450 [Chloroflexota bacterium]
MTNRYRQGYRAELALMKRLRAGEEFHTVIRSAGSRSPFDVVAIGREGILLCQVKAGKGGHRAAKRELASMAFPDCVRVEVWIYRQGKWDTTRVR